MKIDVSELAAEANMSELEVVQEAAAKLGDDFGFTAADVSKLDLKTVGISHVPASCSPGW